MWRAVSSTPTATHKYSSTRDTRPHYLKATISLFLPHDTKAPSFSIRTPVGNVRKYYITQTRRHRNREISFAYTSSTDTCDSDLFAWKNQFSRLPQAFYSRLPQAFYFGACDVRMRIPWRVIIQELVSTDMDNAANGPVIRILVESSTFVLDPRP